MNRYRRQIAATAALLPALAWLPSRAEDQPMNNAQNPMLSSFANGKLIVPEGSGWRGFSDRVMGGISDAELATDSVDGRDCLRLTGTVTRESNGGFIQMAYFFGNNYAMLDASAYAGIELLVFGNNEDYNVHIRTKDCGWYDESYRYTFTAPDEWTRIRIAWNEFKPNGVSVPLDPSTLQRIALLGWMREFQADLALAELSLYA